MRFSWVLPGLMLLACSSEESAPAGAAGGAGAAGADAGQAGSDAGMDASDAIAPSGWQPGQVHPTARTANARGYLDRRGLIHAHSVYSHDACDGMPTDDAGAINQQCFDDFRQGLCASRHDFVMLTDHRESFTSTEFPDVLLYRSARGDALVDHAGVTTANWAACPNQDPALIMAGCEAATMPVGLEGHVSPDQSVRSGVYGDATPMAIDTLKAQGAVSLVAHTEDWTVDQLSTLPLDGFEMYNVHANLFRGVGEALALLSKLSDPSQVPHSDLILVPLFSEDPAYLDTWGSVLASGVKRVTTMGTDCHRNTFKQLLPDGERVDSYRRLMIWFSNHLLIQPAADGSWDDRALKDALRNGRLYGAFEMLGYPQGFDFFASAGATTLEMGGEAALSESPVLHVATPTVQELDPSKEPPVVTLRVLRARVGGWDQVSESTTDIAYPVTMPGAYRVEVRMRPKHLRSYLASYADLADKDFVWIYSNPIYVAP